MQKLLRGLAAVFVLSAWARAQDTVKVEVRITSVTNGSCYLDKGGAAGIAVGDRVMFFPATGPGSEGTVRAVAKNSSRAQIEPGAPAVNLGDRGEVTIPAQRLAKSTPPPVKPPAPQGAAPAQPVSKVGEEPSTASTPQAAPAHPAWQQPPEAWSKDKPLLAPAFGLTPEERESRLRGHAYVQGQGTWDHAGSSRTYLNGNAGFDATMDNPFGDGGSFHVDMTQWTRSTDADFDNVHTSESRLRVNRFTYEVGGTEDDPTHWQFGRFLQREFPELGVLDGVEWDKRLADGSVVGASAGAMPEPFSAMSSFDDLQGALYYRHAFDDKRRNTLGIAYENTWHNGTQDRNLFVADAAVAPSDSVRLNSTALIDWYGSEDTIKDQGFELTEFLVAGTWLTTTTSGIGVTYSHRRIPEILRSEFQTYDAQTVRDGQLDRVTFNGWFQATPRVRFDARADEWSDQDDSGSTLEVGTSMRDLLYREGEVSASVFHADGSFSSGPGFRVQASKAFGRASTSLGYTYVDYAQKDFTGQQSQLAQQALFGSFDFPLSERLDLSLLGERRFGDAQDAYTLGFLLQWRF
jgi:hypothetical protein